MLAACSSVKWNVGMRAVSHGRSFTIEGSFKKGCNHSGWVLNPSVFKFGGHCACSLVGRMSPPEPSIMWQPLQFFSEMKVRHLQKFFRTLHAADVEDAWILQFLFVPGMP